MIGSIFQGISPTWYFQGLERMKKIAISKFYSEKIVKVNPALLIKSWYDIIIIPYKKYLLKGRLQQ